jgi:hypothetical protein
MEDIQQPKSFLDKTKDAVSGVIDKSKETVSSVVDKGHETFTTDTGKPNVLLIVSVFLVMLVIYLVMYYYRQSVYAPFLILEPIPITQYRDLNVPGDSIPDSIFSEEYSYSAWIYVSDDTFKSQYQDTGQDKYIILSRQDSTSSSKMVYAIQNISKQRTLLVRYASAKALPDTDLLQDETNVFKCDVENIPYNTFFHLAVVVYGHTIVVYINGVLVKTITHGDKLKTLNTSDTIRNEYEAKTVVYPTFKGYISKLKYFVDISKQDGGALSDKQVYDLYLNGPYPSLFERMVNSISRRFISFTDDAREEIESVSVGVSGLFEEQVQLAKRVAAAAKKAKEDAEAAAKKSADLAALASRNAAS